MCVLPSTTLAVEMCKDNRGEGKKKYSAKIRPLKAGHVGKTCTLKYKCRKCDTEGHHISLCAKNESRNVTENTNITYNDNQNNILLQTAVAEVACVGKANYHTVRLMLDSGSQRTYITQRLQAKLGLKKIRGEN